MANRTKLTPEKRERFFEILRDCANVTSAALGIGISRRHVYEVRDADPGFAKAWDEAVEQGVDRLEREMWRRAVEGVEKPVYQQGKMVGAIQEYSDTLAIFLAKGHRPGKYRERFEHSGPDGGPIKTDGAMAVTIRFVKAGEKT